MHLRLAAAVYNSIALVWSGTSFLRPVVHGRVPRTGTCHSPRSVSGCSQFSSSYLFSLILKLFQTSTFSYQSIFSVEHTIFSIFCYEIFQTQKRKIVSKYTYTYHLGSVTLCSIIYVSTNPSILPWFIHHSILFFDRFQIKLQTSGHFTPWQFGMHIINVNLVCGWEFFIS